ncbi:MAG TPA: AAA family ATPase [Thermomicrobiales bacterium]|nr:AAA family ATPase [Thermomicrobiales bacterium]
MTGIAQALAPAGRGLEATRIEALLDSARAGQGCALLLSGEPGIGKTHVLEFATEAASRAEFLVVRGACFEDATHIPLYPFRDVTRGLGLALAGDVYGGLESVPALSALAPDLAAARTRASDFSDMEQRDMLFDAVLHLFRRVSAARPVAVLLDDLQWADESSILLLRQLTRSIRTLPVAIVGALRDTDVAEHGTLDRFLLDVRRERTGVHMTLRRLTREETREMASAVLEAPTERVPDSLIDVVHRESEGVPLFVEEWIRHLREEGFLRRVTDSSWGFDTARGLSAPRAVRNVIAERLARLEPATRATLEILAVAGWLGSAHLLHEVAAEADLTSDAVDAALDDAARRRLIAPAASPELENPAHALAFTHEQIRHVILSELRRSLRVALHLAVAEAVAADGAVRADQAGTLAHHFARGGDSARAIEYTLRAAEDARRRFAPNDAVRHYSTALDLLATSGGSFDGAEDDATQVIRVLFELEELYSELGDDERRSDVIERLRASVDASAGRRLRFKLAVREARRWVDAGDSLAARERAAEALRLAGADRAEAVDAHLAMCEACVGRRLGVPSPLLDPAADLIRAEEALTAARDFAETAGDAGLVARIDQELGVLIWGSARPEDEDLAERSRTLLTSALQTYRVVGDRKREVTALIALAYRRPTAASDENLSHVDSYVSFLEEIRRLRVAEHRLTRTIERPRSEALALLSIHLFCRTNGWYEIAIDRGARALEWAMEARDERIALIARTGLSETERLIGRGARALGLAETALASLEHRDAEMPSLEGLRDSVLEALAAAHASVGIRARAEQLARERVESANSTGQAASIAASLAGLAEALESLGSDAAAVDAAHEALRHSLTLTGNITTDIRAETVLARIALKHGSARQALGFSTAATGKVSQRETPLAWLRVASRLAHGLALEASGHHDDAVDEVAEAHELVSRIATRITDSSLRATYLSRSELAAATLAAATRLGVGATVVGANSPDDRPGGLTSREIEVLRLVSSGLPNRDIADRLFISEKTVARHLTNTFNKIDAQSRTQAAAWAYRNGIV